MVHLAGVSGSPDGLRVGSYAPAPSESRRGCQLQAILADADAVLLALGLTALPTKPTGPTLEPTPADLARWARLARSVRRQLAALDSRAAALAEERALLARYHSFLDPLDALLRARGDAPNAAAFHLVLRADQAGGLPALRKSLGALLGDSFETIDRPLDGGGTAVLLIVPDSSAAKVERVLSDTRVQEVPVPAGYGGSLVEAVPRMRRRERELPGELAAVDAERKELARRHGPAIVAAAASLRDWLARTDAMVLSGVTAHAFVLEGWLPETLEPKLAEALERAFGSDIVLEWLGAEQWEGEAAPVVLHNPRLFRPFELLTGMLPLPRYGTIDPTPYVAIFFPMFFGLIVGDVGYGAALAVIAWVLHRRSRPETTLRAVSEVAGACALFAIIFGVLFGEYFGDAGHRWLGLHPIWMDRETAILPFLALTIALGVVHIVLGLVLGALSAGRRHPRQATGRGLSAAMVVLIVIALLAAMEVLPAALLTPAVVAILIAFVVLIAVEGVVAPIELLTTLGHILSYARIMALGTASVMLAVVANQLGGAMGSVLVGAVFALLFHLVNFALGLFGPTIHALRLHYVEFFGTFYSPGGIRYTPLGHGTPRTGARPA